MNTPNKIKRKHGLVNHIRQQIQKNNKYSYFSYYNKKMDDKSKLINDMVHYIKSKEL